MIDLLVGSSSFCSLFNDKHTVPLSEVTLKESLNLPYIHACSVFKRRYRGIGAKHIFVAQKLFRKEAPLETPKPLDR